MDRTGIIVVSLCAALLVFWFIKSNKLAVETQRQQAQFAATNQLSKAQSQPVTSTATAVAPTPVTTPGLSFDTNAPERLLVLTNDRARYTFASRGGGLKLVELLD